MIGRTNAGGSGSLPPNNAVIHVVAPVGSTISFTKGGITAKVLGPDKGHVSADNNTVAEWYYAIFPNNYGAWTVTTTLETDTASDTASDTVTISENKQYDVFLTFNLYFIRNGQILVPKAPYSSSNWEASIEQVDGAVAVRYEGDAGSAAVLWQITESLLNGRVYTKLAARVRSWNVYNNNEMSQISICNSNYSGSRTVYTNAYGTTFPGDLIVDCSLVNLTNKYACVRVAESGRGVAVIKDFYLTR